MAEDEAIIKHRFLTQTTVTKGEPPFKRLVKRYTEFAAEIENGSAEKANELYQVLLKELALIEFQMHKLEFQRSALQREAGEYRSRQAHLDEETAKARRMIEDRKRELQDARVWRRHQEEYEALRKLVMQHPSRAETQAGIEALRGEIASIGAQDEAALLAIERRRKQFALLLHCVDDLQRGLDEEEAQQAAAAAAAAAAATAGGGGGGGGNGVAASASQPNLQQQAGNAEPMALG